MEGPFYPLYLVALGALGLIFGSFANVLIWRFPRGESVVSPGSHCPKCGNPIRPYDNVPVVSWLLLGARCRDCGTPIHWRYPVVEALSGVLWVAAGLRFGPTPRAAVAIVLFYMLLVLAFIDLDTMRLPNKLVGTLAFVGLAAALASQFTGLAFAPLTPLPVGGLLATPVGAALLGVLVGGGFVALLTWGYALVRGGSGFGMGDVKLIAVAGLFLGPYVLIALLLSSAFAIAGSFALVRGGEGPVRSRRFPFGPFLACGIVTAALAGPAIAAWYLSLLS